MGYDCSGLHNTYKSICISVKAVLEKIQGYPALT